jgi:hypothetical protein
MVIVIWCLDLKRACSCKANLTSRSAKGQRKTSERCEQRASTVKGMSNSGYSRVRYTPKLLAPYRVSRTTDVVDSSRRTPINSPFRVFKMRTGEKSDVFYPIQDLLQLWYTRPSFGMKFVHLTAVKSPCHSLLSVNHDSPRIEGDLVPWVPWGSDDQFHSKKSVVFFGVRKSHSLSHGFVPHWWQWLFLCIVLRK